MTSFCLKIIAIITMTIHHISMSIGQGGLMTLFPNLSMHASFYIIAFMDGISRIAFPLFAFMVAEGSSKTHSMPKYIGRLALFAVISEPIYYFALTPLDRTVEGFIASLSRFNLTNVLFTLMLGAIAIYCYQFLERRKSQKASLLFVPILLLILLFSRYFNCNYGMEGVALIVALYLVKKKSHKMLVVILWSFVLYIFGQSGYGYNWSQVSGRNIAECLLAASSCIFICLYNGKRGRPVKRSFYIYYPAHLLILTLISFAVHPPLGG